MGGIPLTNVFKLVSAAFEGDKRIGNDIIRRLNEN